MSRARKTVTEATPTKRKWPLSAENMAPIAWWRVLPSDLLGHSEQLLVHATMKRITVMRGGKECAAALQGDPAVAIAVAFSAMPIKKITLEIDIAMTALMRCALDGSAAAALVLAHVLGRAELEHPFGRELSTSWYAHNLRHSPKGRGFRPQERALLCALQAHDARPPFKGGRA